MKIQTIFLSSVIGFLTGCAGTSGVSSPLSPYTAELSISRDCSKEYSSYCEYSYTLTNTNARYVDPTLDVLLVDCDNNTLEERTIFFDKILGGKRQTKKYDHPKSDNGRVKLLLLEGSSGMGYYFRGFNGSETVNEIV